VLALARSARWNAAVTIPIYDTFIAPDAAARVSRVLETTFVSQGPVVAEFEGMLSTQLGIVNPVTVNSGTTALHLALVLAGIGPGDEVICPAQTFVASALAIRYEGGVPVFADVDYETGNVDPRSIREKLTEKTRAILVVHWAGTPCDLDEIHAIAAERGIPVIEDAAHALGATYKGQPIGAVSDYTCFSFQAIKHVTTGDGGAVAVREPERAAEAIRRRWFGIDRAASKPSFLGERQYDIEAVGYKYHLNDYSAALGVANLASFPDRLRRIREIAAHYRRELADVPGLRPFRVEPDRESAYWLYGMHVEGRDELIRALHAAGIVASVVHQRIDRNSVFGGPKELPNQARFDESQLHIPIYARLTDEQVEHIVTTIRRGWSS